MSPSPAPVAVALDPIPAQWWEILGALGPLAILLSAIVAAVLGGFTLRQRTQADALALVQKRESDAAALEQKRRSDERSEWWTRAQWALDRALDDRPATKTLGLATLDVLGRSTLARTEELELFDIAWASVNGQGGGQAMPRGITELAPQERLVQVTSARLRMTLDGRLGRITPDEVKALAREPL